MTTSTDELRQRILTEMTVDHSDSLEKSFDVAKQFLAITKEGKIDVLVKDRVIGKDQILLYLIGKLYSQRAGLSETQGVGNKELLEELGIPEGSLFPWLKELRETNKVKQVRTGKMVKHVVSTNFVEKILRSIELSIQETN